jgi:hypothetical protein
LPKEYIIKAVVHAVISQAKDQKEHLRIAQNFFINGWSFTVRMPHNSWSPVHGKMLLYPQAVG